MDLRIEASVWLLAGEVDVLLNGGPPERDGRRGEVDESCRVVVLRELCVCACNPSPSAPGRNDARVRVEVATSECRLREREGEQQRGAPCERLAIIRDVLDSYRSGAYAEQNLDWHDSDAPDKARGLAEIARFMGLSPHTVADVGCGTGRVLSEFKRRLDVHWPDTIYEGWDIAAIPINSARKVHEGDRITFVEGDLLESERRVDLLLCVDVIEHIPDERAFLEAIRTRAAWFLFRIPLDLSALDVVRPKRLIEASRRYGHRHFYTRDTALALLDDAKFHVEFACYDRLSPPRDTLRRQLADVVRRSALHIDADRAVRWLGGFSLLVCAKAR